MSRVWSRIAGCCVALGVALRRSVPCGVVLFALTLPAAAQSEREPERTGGPYVPTPQVVVDQMLRFANVGASDFVVDLGSGDGVIVLTAASEFKAHGFGVDIDPALVKSSNAEAQRLGVADRAAFYVQDVFKADLTRASVVTMYLLPGMMINLRSKIYLEPKPGTRVVSHDYHFGGEWQPDDQLTFDVPEKEKVNGVPRATIYLWIIPAKIGGRWKVNAEDAGQYEITLRQNFQTIQGSARAGNRTMPLLQPAVRGDEVTFALANGSERLTFKGRATATGMSGTVDLGKGRTAHWTATH